MVLPLSLNEIVTFPYFILYGSFFLKSIIYNNLRVCKWNIYFVPSKVLIFSTISLILIKLYLNTDIVYSKSPNIYNDDKDTATQTVS